LMRPAPTRTCRVSAGFNQVLAAEKRVTATAIQTVGSKGYDGLAIVRVESEMHPQAD